MDTNVDETAIVNMLRAGDKAVFTSLVELKDVFLKLFQDWKKILISRCELIAACFVIVEWGIYKTNRLLM